MMTRAAEKQQYLYILSYDTTHATVGCRSLCYVSLKNNYGKDKASSVSSTAGIEKASGSRTMNGKTFKLSTVRPETSVSRTAYGGIACCSDARAHQASRGGRDNAAEERLERCCHAAVRAGEAGTASGWAGGEAVRRYETVCNLQVHHL